jgi:hypothetical protein
MDFTSNAEHARAMLALRGTLRGSGTVLDEMVTVDMALAAGETVQRIDVMIAEGALDRIRAARSG